MDFPSDILLFKVNPSKNERRFYCLKILRNLFGEYELLREFGRIGQSGCIMIERFEHPDEAEVAFCALARQKLSRGYRRIYEGSSHACADPEMFRVGRRVFDVIDDPLSSILLRNTAERAHDQIVEWDAGALRPRCSSTSLMAPHAGV